MNLDERTHHSLATAVVTAALALVGSALTWCLVWAEINSPPVDVDWSVFVVVAALMLICQRIPATWIRFGPIGAVTPLWLFSYALFLLGAPAVGLGLALIGATLHAISQVESVSALVHRVAGTAISLSTAGLLLSAMGVHGAITRFDEMPWDWGAAIALGGVGIVLLNAVVAAISMSVRRRISFVALFRHGLGARITAEGAMLSLAPIWVIGIDFSLVLVPLLAITTVLVFSSTRQALERAHEAGHDQLTGMVNRNAFLELLAESLVGVHAPTRSTLLIMDLNGFKDVNDRLGHQIGDALLIAFADRLERSRPQHATAARLGGDEFAVLLMGTESDAELQEDIVELHRRLSEPLAVEGFPVTVGVSIGVAHCPSDGRTSRDLLRAADVAMYKAKRTGSAIEYYENCIRSPQRGRLNLLSELNTALEDHQFLINYQPQLRISDGSVDTVEALIRWQHPQHGLIPPSEFIGLAEQTDLIGPITTRVLRMATQGLMTGAAAQVRLAVNVSARSLQDEHFGSTVLDVLADSGFDPARLEIEVTERGLVTNAERSMYVINQLRGEGVRIAIDDFGIGYSSYQTLRMLDVDRVKIDRDFVQGLLTQPRDRKIVSSLIELSHSLGLDVVAEGVESAPIWDSLAVLDCDVAQGYGIASPMSYPDLREWLDRWNAVVAEQSVSAAIREPDLDPDRDPDRDPDLDVGRGHTRSDDEDAHSALSA